MASVVVTGASVSSVWTGRDRASRKPRASTTRRRRGWTRAALAGGAAEVAASRSFALDPHLLEKRANGLLVERLYVPDVES